MDHSKIWLGWGGLTTSAILIVISLLSSRQCARQMGETYTFKQAITDTWLLWFLMFLGFDKLVNAQVFRVSNDAYVSFVLFLCPFVIWAWRVCPTEMTFQRFSQWNQHQDSVAGKTVTRDEIQRRFRWLMPMVLGCVLVSMSVFLWMKSFNPRSVVVAGVGTALLLPFIWWKVNRLKRQYLSETIEERTP